MSRFIFLILFLACFAPLQVEAATVNAESASLAHVSAAIAAANPGDTVVVPIGTATWEETLVITRGIVLQGAGAGQTVITGAAAISTPTYGVIRYAPSAAAITADDPFRITGFTISALGDVYGITVYQNTSTPITKVRIDNNSLSVAGNARNVYIVGSVYGVVDSNTITETGTGSKAIDTYGNNTTQWESPALAFEYGTRNNMYSEDNTINHQTTPHSSGQGGRYVVRYNTYNYSGTSHLSPWYDAHGNQHNCPPDGIGDDCTYENWGTMGVEIYGNAIDAGAKTVAPMFDIRGGQAIAFNNHVTTSYLSGESSHIREEVADDSNPILERHPSAPMHVNNAYFWANYVNEDLLPVAESSDCCDAIAENSEFYNYTATFDGTVGIGSGLYADMPATCTVGVAYWATDKGGNWHLTNETENDGTLYKCTEINTWTDYYTPYTYPHPLRDATAPESTITQSDPQAITSDALTLTGTCTDVVGVTSAKYRLSSSPDGSDGTACTGTTSWTCNTGGYSIGANDVYVGCADAAGNWTSPAPHITANFSYPSGAIAFSSPGTGAITMTPNNAGAITITPY